MKIGPQPEKWLRKKAKQGMRGYPVGSIAFYGPDRDRASKVAVGVIAHQALWPSCGAGSRKRAREDAAIGSAIAEHPRSRGVHSVSMVDRIIGCPHEEGIDDPDGESCPHSPYWKGRDRWSDD